MALAVITYASGGGDTTAESPVAEATETAEPTATAKPTARATPIPVPTAVPRQDLVLVGSGYTAGQGEDWVLVGVVLENPNPDTWVADYVQVQFLFRDAAGNLAGSGDSYVSTILPGQRGAIGNAVFDVVNAASMEVQVRVSRWTEIDFDPGTFSFEQLSVTPGTYGGWDVSGLMNSTFANEQESVRVDVIFFNGDTVIGGDFTFVDFVPAGGQTGFNLSTFSQWNPAVTGVQAYAGI